MSRKVVIAGQPGSPAVPAPALTQQYGWRLTAVLRETIMVSHTHEGCAARVADGAAGAVLLIARQPHPLPGRY